MKIRYCLPGVLLAGTCALFSVEPPAGQRHGSPKTQWITVCPGCPNNPFGITENGTISGIANTPQGERGFILSRKGEVTWVDTPGHVLIELLKGNNRGQFTGVYYSNADFRVHGFVRERDGALRDITYPGASTTVASAINDSGEILASYSNSPVPFGYVSYVQRPWGSISEFIRYPGADSTIALGFNARGEMAGVFLLANSYALHGFIRTRRNSLIEVAFPAASEIYLSDINASGTAVGFWRDAEGAFHGLVYQDRHCYTVDPGTSPNGYTNTTFTSINNSGDAVGVNFPLYPGDGDGFMMTGVIRGTNVAGGKQGVPCAIPPLP